MDKTNGEALDLNKLLPCPFCCGAARFEQIGNWHDLVVAHVEDCLLSGVSAEMSYLDSPGVRDIMTAKWNRRAGTAAPTGQQAEPVRRRTVTNPDGSTTTYISEYEHSLEMDLAECRDLFDVPESGELHDLWSEACSEPRAVAAYVKAQFNALAILAAPAAAQEPTLMRQAVASVRICQGHPETCSCDQHNPIDK